MYKKEEKTVASRSVVHRRLREFGLSGGARRKLRDQINSLLGAFDSGSEASLARVLHALYPAGTEKSAQGNFRAFKMRFNETLRANGVPLELASTRGTTPPDKRFAWFWDLAPADADLRLGVEAARRLTERALSAAAGAGAELHNSNYGAAAGGAFVLPDVYAPGVPCAVYRFEMRRFFREFFPAEWRKYSGSQRRFLSGLTTKLEPIRRISPHPDTPHEVAGFEALAFDAEGRSYTGISHFCRESGIIPAVWLVGLLYASLLTIRRIAVTLPLKDVDIHIDRIFFAMNMDPRMLASPALKRMCAVYRGLFPGRFYFEVKETFPKGFAGTAKAFFEETGFRYALDDVDEADPVVRAALEGGAALVKIGYKRSKPLLDLYSSYPQQVLAELRSFKMKGKPLVVEALDEDVRQMFLYESWKEEWGELLAQGRDLDAGPFYGRHLTPLKGLGITGGGFVLPAEIPDETDNGFSYGGDSCSNGKSSFIYEKQTPHKPQSAAPAVCEIAPPGEAAAGRGAEPSELSNGKETTNLNYNEFEQSDKVTHTQKPGVPGGVPEPGSYALNNVNSVTNLNHREPVQSDKITHVQKPAMNLLLRWAGALKDTEDRIDEHFPAVVALLGGAGTGKTALCRAFARELLRLADAGGAAAPVPALVEIGLASPKLRAAIERGDSPGAIEAIAYTAESLGIKDFPSGALLRAVAAGRVVLIFDGPEEAAARAPRLDAVRFLAALGSAVRKRCPNRMLIACRDTYFLDSEDELEKLPGGAEPVFEGDYGGGSPVCGIDAPGGSLQEVPAENSAGSASRNVGGESNKPAGFQPLHGASSASWMPSPMIVKLAPFDPDQSREFIRTRVASAAARGREENKDKINARESAKAQSGSAAETQSHKDAAALVPNAPPWERGRPARILNPESAHEQNGAQIAAEFWNVPGFRELISLPAALEFAAARAAKPRGRHARDSKPDALAEFVRAAAAKDAARSLLRPDLALELLERLALELYKTGGHATRADERSIPAGMAGWKPAPIERTIHAGDLYRWFRREIAAEFPAAGEESIEALETSFRLSPFLRRDAEGRFGFIAPGVRRYFTARAVARGLSRGDANALDIPALSRETMLHLAAALKKPPFSSPAATAAVQKHLDSGYILGDTDFSKNIVLFLNQIK